MRRRFKAGLAGAVLAAASLSTTAQAAIRLRVFYTTDVQSSLGPVTTPPTELDFIMRGQTVDFQAFQNGALVARSSGGQQNQQGNLYGPVLLNIRATPRALTLIGTYTAQQVIGTFRTDGQRTCSGSVQWRLRPGFHSYSFEIPGLGINADVSAVRTRNISCQLSVEP